MQIVCQRSRLFLLLVGLFLPALACAELKLPHLFSDGAVLQRDQAIPVWGWGEPMTDVKVTLGDQSQTVKVDAQGQWQARFPPLPAGRTLQLTVSQEDATRQVTNMITGDVWLCSGQSNMEWPLRNAQGYQDVIAGGRSPTIRHFKVPLSWAEEPTQRLAGGQWQTAASNAVGDFSAVAYFFAEDIVRQTGVPVGLLCANWGGSNIESWMSPAARDESPQATAERIQRHIDRQSAQAEVVKQKLARWPTAFSEDAQQTGTDWSAAKLDTRDWMSLTAPGLWESQGLQGVDGVIWYRRLFALTPEQTKNELTLGLARIDDNDTTWVNGMKVGETQGYDRVREYTVPAAVLHSGLNSIAIRVEDTGGGGGIYSEENLLYLRTHDGEQSLAGGWQVKADKVTINPSANMNHVPGALYNKMIAPLFNAPIKGVIWYQGESNAGSVKQARNYAKQFQALIQDWRSAWQQNTLPFYWVQLANYETGLDSGQNSPWAVLRASQAAALSLPATGQASAIDVGDPDDIHPRDKKTVGQRLARIALHQVYGNKELHYEGPVLQSAVLEYQRLALAFKAPAGLKTQAQGDPVKGIEVLFRGDTTFTPVEGKIDGQRVIVPIADQPRPVSVRYAWKDNPEEANLQDSQGLPAMPFAVDVSVLSLL